MRRTGLALVCILAIAAGLGARAVLAQTPPPQPAVTASTPDAALIARGRYIAVLGDCEDCHTVKGQAPFAGGRPLQTPFGTILSANITPDRATGIGNWTADQFYRALHQGIDDAGNHLYPAFPYNYYTLVSRADTDALFAYMKSIPPVSHRFQRNQLPFPFNIRPLMAVWDWLFLKVGEYRLDPMRPAQWNRGAYLVNGLGHCGACHTPGNFLGAPKQDQFLQGGTFAQWFAPDLTPNRRTGLGAWSHDDALRFLKTGRNPHAAAAAEMGEVVNFSTSQTSDADLEAILDYIGDQRASPAPAAGNIAANQMRDGEAIYVDSCSACHAQNGEGVPQFFPPLRGDANLQQRDPTTTVHFILTGIQSTPTQAWPTGFSMPAYAWKLTDGEVAAVENYIRNAWGNSAPAISAGDVASLRGKLVAKNAQYSPPEGRGSLQHPTPSTLAPANTDSRDNGTPSAGRAAPANDGPAAAGGNAGVNGGTSPSPPGGNASTGPG